MNRNLVKRWMNEYLDGEIGLADKIELERLMSQDPELREEYRRMREMGLLLGSQPEVDVHPTRFRVQLADRLDEEAKPAFTPQRAFAMAMVVALLVVGLSMGMLVYQQGVLGRGMSAGANTQQIPAAATDDYSVVIDTGVAAERYFSRLLLSQQLGLVEASTIEPLLSQTRVYEGAVCNSRATDPLFNLQFQRSLGQPVSIDANSRVASSLALMSLELSGRQPMLLVRNGETASMSLTEFTQLYGENHPLTVVLIFSSK